MRRYPIATKEQALSLRGGGRSLQEISNELGIPKNTVQVWVKHIELSPDQRMHLTMRERLGASHGRQRALEANRIKIEQWKQKIRNQVKPLCQLPLIDERIGKLVCATLYFCEGGKYPKTRAAVFANADPGVIRLYLVLLRRYFGVREEKFRVQVLCRWDQDGDTLCRFWSDVTRIPLRQFHKWRKDSRTQGKPTLQETYRGVCVIVYCDTTLQYILQSTIEEVITNVLEQEGIEPSTYRLPACRSPN